MLSAFRSLVEGLVQMMYQPTLAGFMAPAAAVIAAGVVVWNVIEMISFE